MSHFLFPQKKPDEDLNDAILKMEIAIRESIKADHQLIKTISQNKKGTN